MIPPVKTLDYLLRKPLYLEVLEDCGAAAYHLPQVFVAVGGLLGRFQLLRIRQKPGPQPLGRGGEIGAVMHQPPGGYLQGILVGPVPGHGRRIEALQGQGKVSAPEDGLLRVPDFFRPRKLVQLLKPGDAGIPKGRL